MCSSVCEYVLTLSWRSYSFALSHVRERSVCLSNTPIERSSMCAYVLSLSWTRSPGNPGTNQWSLVKGVGSFSRGVAVVIWHSPVCQNGGFSEKSSASTSRRRDGVARHALGTPSDDCDSVRIGSRDRVPNCPGHSIGCQKPCSWRSFPLPLAR